MKNVPSIDSTLRDILTAIKSSDAEAQVYHLRSVSPRREAPWRPLQAAAAKQFASLNGWEVSARGFNPENIGSYSYQSHWIRENTIWDHCLYFRVMGRKKCAAIVAQPYDHFSVGSAESVARQYNIECHIPPHPTASIYYPGSCVFIVYTAVGHQIRWLPEQLTGIVGLEARS
jgi:hypothetical protein